jgi:hypothetical protein
MAVLVVGALTLTACAQDVPPITCEDADFDCFVKQAAAGIRIVRENISYWSNVNLIGQALIVVAGIVATIMIALQGDENKVWTRPIGLIATALVTGMTSALVSFHVPDNVDKLVDILGNMTNITNEFGYQSAKLSEGKDLKEVQQRFKTDAAFRNSINELTKKYVDDYNAIKIDMLKLNGTASRLSTIQSPSNSSKKANP